MSLLEDQGLVQGSQSLLLKAASPVLGLCLLFGSILDSVLTSPSPRTGFQFHPYFRLLCVFFLSCALDCIFIVLNMYYLAFLYAEVGNSIGLAHPVSITANPRECGISRFLSRQGSHLLISREDFSSFRIFPWRVTNAEPRARDPHFFSAPS